MLKKNYINPTITVRMMEGETLLAASAEMPISDNTTSNGGEDGNAITSGDAKESRFSVWDE